MPGPESSKRCASPTHSESAPAKRHQPSAPTIDHSFPSLDIQGFPHIYAQILAGCDEDSLIALRTASKAVKNDADELLVRHLIITGCDLPSDFRTPTGRHLPALYNERHLDLPPHTRLPPSRRQRAQRKKYAATKAQSLACADILAPMRVLDLAAPLTIAATRWLAPALIQPVPTFRLLMARDRAWSGRYNHGWSLTRLPSTKLVACYDNGIDSGHIMSRNDRSIQQHMNEHFYARMPWADSLVLHNLYPAGCMATYPLIENGELRGRWMPRGALGLQTSVVIRFHAYATDDYSMMTSYGWHEPAGPPKNWGVLDSIMCELLYRLDRSDKCGAVERFWLVGLPEMDSRWLDQPEGLERCEWEAALKAALITRIEHHGYGVIPPAAAHSAMESIRVMEVDEYEREVGKEVADAEMEGLWSF